MPMAACKQVRAHLQARSHAAATARLCVASGASRKVGAHAGHVMHARAGVVAGGGCVVVVAAAAAVVVCGGGGG